MTPGVYLEILFNIFIILHGEFHIPSNIAHTDILGGKFSVVR